MKKIIITALTAALVLAAFTLMGAQQKDPKEAFRDVYRLFGQKKYEEALTSAKKMETAYGTSKELTKLTYTILVNLKKYDEALAYIDEKIKAGETVELVSARYNVLLRLGKLEEALAAAKKKDEIAETKSPWNRMNIMDVYLLMGRKQDALDELQEAVSRGFISYRILEGKKYTSLHKEKRFYEIIETIKIAIGLGHPARFFTVKLLSGEDFTLLRQRGKVVLVDFWATWCDSCRKEMPQLKQYYSEFKDKGFEMIGISLDSSVERLKRYVEANKLEWKMAYSGDVWKDATVIRYGVNSIPSHWLIDKRGVLRSFGLEGEALRQAIAALLAEE